jgi:hypothetical protein
MRVWDTNGEYEMHIQYTFVSPPKILEKKDIVVVVDWEKERTETRHERLNMQFSISTKRRGRNGEKRY